MKSESYPESVYPQADFFALKKPDWTAWQTTRQTALWKATVLACDLDPVNFQLPGSENLVRSWKELPQQAEDLLTAAKGSLGSNGILKVVATSTSGLEEYVVDLANFAAWLLSMRHPMPDGFPWGPEEIDLNYLHWPWGQHSTALLRNLAEAANKFWKNYDPADPSSAPTNKQVTAWLEKRGVAARNATAIATILRDDKLPPGPRK